MKNRRREFLQRGLLAGAGLLTAPFVPGLASAQGSALRATPLRGQSVLITGAGCNIVANRTGGELLVVDGGLAARSTDLLALFQAEFGTREIATLTNSHWHAENVGLNTAVAGTGTRIFAHENTRQWLSTEVKRLWEDRRIAPLPPAAQPTETFYHYGEFSHGGTEVQYGYLRQAHTDGDMYIYLPEDNVLHTGGVISSDGWPFMDWWTGGWIGGIVDAIETLLSVAREDTLIVPGSGPLMTRAELSEMRGMYEQIYQTVRRGFQAANTAEQTVASKPAAAWEGKYGNADQFIELSHWSLIPHLTPDA